MGNVCVEKGFSSSFLFFFFTLLDFYRLFYFKHAGHRHWCIYVYVHLDRIFFLFGAGTVDFSFSIVIHTYRRKRRYSTSAAHLHIIHMEKLSPIRSSFFFFPKLLLLILIFGPRGFFFFLRRKREQTRWKYYYYNSLICWNAVCGIAAGPTGPATFVFFSFFYGWLSSPYIFFWGGLA